MISTSSKFIPSHVWMRWVSDPDLYWAVWAVWVVKSPSKCEKCQNWHFHFLFCCFFFYSFSLIHFLFTVSCKWEVQKPDGQFGALWGYLGSKKQFRRAFLNNTEQTRIFYRSYLICRMFVAIILVSIEIDSLWKAQVPIEGTLEFFWDALKFLGVPNKPSKGIF